MIRQQSKQSDMEIFMAHPRYGEKVRQAVFPVAGTGASYLPALA